MARGHRKRKDVAVRGAARSVGRRSEGAERESRGKRRLADKIRVRNRGALGCGNIRPSPDPASPPRGTVPPLTRCCKALLLGLTLKPKLTPIVLRHGIVSPCRHAIPEHPTLYAHQPTVVTSDSTGSGQGRATMYRRINDERPPPDHGPKTDHPASIRVSVARPRH